MDGKIQCARCGRQFDEGYQFCPFDATPLGRKCPSCGRTWDSTYHFCPLDSTPLSVLALEPTAAPSWGAPRADEGAAASPTPPPQPLATPAPPPPLAQPASFTFIEQSTKSSWKATLFRPVTVLFALGLVATGYAVWYLNWRTSGPDLPPPAISYTLLPNEGKTKGVPVAIKVNQLTVFMLDDPLETPEGAARAKTVVAALDETIRPLSKATGEVRFAVEIKDGRPVILVVTQSGPDPRALATVTEADVTLAGETDATRLAALWAERLTDAVKVFVFGEAPTFSTNTEFGQALLAMYKAAMADQGKLTKRALDRAFERLSAAQRRALETPPVVRKTSAASFR